MDGQNTEEGRKCERFSFIEDIVVDGSKQCTSSDISEGGLYISAIQAFEENSVIDVTIPSADFLSSGFHTLEIVPSDLPVGDYKFTFVYAGSVDGLAAISDQYPFSIR